MTGAGVPSITPRDAADALEAGAAAATRATPAGRFSSMSARRMNTRRGEPSAPCSYRSPSSLNDTRSCHATGRCS